MREKEYRKDHALHQGRERRQLSEHRLQQQRQVDVTSPTGLEARAPAPPLRGVTSALEATQTRAILGECEAIQRKNTSRSRYVAKLLWSRVNKQHEFS